MIDFCFGIPCEIFNLELVVVADHGDGAEVYVDMRGSAPGAVGMDC